MSSNRQNHFLKKCRFKVKEHEILQFVAAHGKEPTRHYRIQHHCTSHRPLKSQTLSLERNAPARPWRRKSRETDKEKDQARGTGEGENDALHGYRGARRARLIHACMRIMAVSMHNFHYSTSNNMLRVTACRLYHMDNLVESCTGLDSRSKVSCGGPLVVA